MPLSRPNPPKVMSEQGEEEVMAREQTQSGPRRPSAKAKLVVRDESEKSELKFR